MRAKGSENPMNKIIKIYRLFSKREITAAVGAIVLIAAAFALFSAKYMCCYEFFVNGRSIGFSRSQDCYERIKADVNNEISADFGESEIITAEAISVPVIIRKSDVTEYDEFFDNIAVMSPCMRYAYSLMINGERTISFAAEDDMHTAVRTVVDEYASGGEAQVSEEIGGDDGFVSIADIYGVEDAVNYIKSNGLINVHSVVEATYNEEIAYDEQTVEDADKYTDYCRIVQSGENGEKQISARLVLENGAETAREIISETVIKQPVAQICSVGVKIRPAGVGTGEFIFPTSGTISSRFGERWGKSHDGIDIANGLGTDIYAADDGKVIFSGVQNGYGNIIIIDHGNGYTTKYAHCSQLEKSVGDVVKKGDLIAKSGNTGRSTGNHVHFEICRDGEAVNPLDFVDCT